MKIPDIVRIGSMDYRVEQSKSVIVLNHEECAGMIDYNSHTIQLNTDIRDLQGMEQTFLHEVVHGIMNDRKIEPPEEQLEQIVDSIASGLHQLIRDNPNMFR